MKTQDDHDDEMLMTQSRRFASRHQHIPPTPRDTMAVLMQEAEKNLPQPTFPWRVFTRSWVSAWAALVIAIAAGWLWLAPEHGDRKVQLVQQPGSNGQIDLGLDTATWDMEIDALINELDASLISLTSEQNISSDEESWL